MIACSPVVVIVMCVGFVGVVVTIGVLALVGGIGVALLVLVVVGVFGVVALVRVIVLVLLKGLGIVFVLLHHPRTCFCVRSRGVLFTCSCVWGVVFAL